MVEVYPIGQDTQRKKERQWFSKTIRKFSTIRTGKPEIYYLNEITIDDKKFQILYFMRTKEKEMRMKMKRKLFLITSVFLIVFNAKCIKVWCQEKDEIINKIVTSMTLKEKAQLVVGTGMYFELPDSLASLGSAVNALSNETDPSYSEMVNRIRKYVPGAAGNTAEFPHLGITTQVLADGPAGLRIQPRRKGEEKTYIALLSRLQPCLPPPGIQVWYMRLEKPWETKYWSTVLMCFWLPE